MLRDVPRAEWPRFFESFTMEHDAWPTRVESQTGGIDEGPLEGIVARNGEIIVHLGNDVDSHRRYVITDPQRVREETDSVIEIESAGGLTRLTFL
jgi:hypothetical protein